MLMKTTIYTFEGKTAGTLDLPEHYFGLPWKENFMHEVIVALQSNRRQGTAAAKNRSEVRGGGKKPWKQKGTGRARHGSSRSPIWVGGGVTHGPLTEKKYAKKVNKKVLALALVTALSSKVSAGEFVAVDSLGEMAKTKEAKTLLENLGNAAKLSDLSKRKKNAVLIATHTKAGEKRGALNLPGAEVIEIRNLNPLAVLAYRYLIVENPDHLLKELDKKFAFKSKRQETNA
jgi:large subunit ribosomal protein L4